jgi:hypothetical protein
MFSPTAGGIRETVLHSATAVQVASRNVNSPTGERMMSFPEASEKNNYKCWIAVAASFHNAFCWYLSRWFRHTDKRSS